jgi:pimeloyl-ACP methyl ester carboxylesterase
LCPEPLDHHTEHVMNETTTRDLSAVGDHSLHLPDGRTLAFTDLGPPKGSPVMYFHGAPSSRLDLALLGLDATFHALDVRVVSPDRPGYGGSSPQTGRRLEDWPSDVAALADHLGLARFAVMGISSGGPYAVICAALLPERVASAGVIAGVTDMAWLPAWDGFEDNEAALMCIGDEAGAVAWCEEHYGADGSRFAEGLSDLPAADAAMLNDEAFAAALLTTFNEGFRQGVAGYAQDITVQGRPWSFATTDITAPVRVLHGEADTLLPVAHGRHTAEAIPSAQLVTWPDHGHLSIVAEIPQLCADLVASL